MQKIVLPYFDSNALGEIIVLFCIILYMYVSLACNIMKLQYKL